MSGLDKLSFLLILIGFFGASCVWWTQLEASNPGSDEIIMAQLIEEANRPLTQAEVIMDLWNLSEADIAKPVRLFGGRDE